MLSGKGSCSGKLTVWVQESYVVGKGSCSGKLTVWVQESYVVQQRLLFRKVNWV